MGRRGGLRAEGSTPGSGRKEPAGNLHKDTLMVSARNSE